MSDRVPPPPASALGRRWPWLLLALALVWIGVVRWPLVLNSRHHLDSDLAVDGLTLVEATRGEFRWHYPGTPHIGTAMVGLSLLQGLIWGPTPEALVSGGVVAYLLLAGLTFGLVWRTFGPGPASWSLVPLAFASIGTVWLSGRITGGHLLAAAWHAGAFLLLHGFVSRVSAGRAAVLGLACGLGLWADQMMLFSLVGLIPAALAAVWLDRSPLGSRLAAVAVLLIALAVGWLPHLAGRWADPYDAYETQFSTILTDPRTGRENWPRARQLATQHAWLLALDCLPRLLAGHRLPGFQSEPGPEELGGQPARDDRPDSGAIPVATTVLALTLAALAVPALLVSRFHAEDRAREAVRTGLIASSLAVLAMFVLNLNIYNSDNYRYLVLLLVPWAAGFGLLMAGLARRGSGGGLAAGLLSLALAGLMTADTVRWYRGFGWLDATGWPVRVEVPDRALDWLAAHPEVDAIYGGYWDVYRLAFLTGGRVRGVPYAGYPDRYPEVSHTFPGGRPRWLLGRSDPADQGLRLGPGLFNREQALREGATVVDDWRSGWVIDWPPAPK